MNDFIQRLRERKLVQWALAYAAAAFALLQGFDIVGQQFDWSEGVRRGITIALGVGFVVTLVLAWYHGEKGAQRVTTRELLALALVLVLGGGVMWHFERAAPADVASPSSNSHDASAADKSIAVLPFENLSDDKDNAYFADGMQDEILTRLSKIGTLRVISRTSTLQFASHPENLPEIAKKLGVATILEGSVQKSGNKVRIIVQLIRANDDRHLWGETYDRTLDDVFGVQGEVAGTIADKLGATLTGGARKEIAQVATRNPVALDAYLRGLSLLHKGFMVTQLKASTQAFEDAVKADPDFAAAWAQLAGGYSQMIFFGIDTSPERRAAALHALETAERLQPDTLETQAARARYIYRVQTDYDEARKRFEALHARWPNDVDAMLTLSYILERQGQEAEADALIAQALRLDPLNAKLHKLADKVALDERRFDETIAQAHAALALAPDDSEARRDEAAARLARGDLTRAAQLLDHPPTLLSVESEQGQYFELERLQRSHATSIARLERMLQTPDPKAEPLDTINARTELADMQRLAGDRRAEGNYRMARAALLDLQKTQGENPNLLLTLSVIEAGLGHEPTAFAGVDAFLRKIPESKDVLFARIGLDLRARLLARFGHKDEAIAGLRYLLGVSYLGSVYPITPASLRLDPDFDSLRGDPAFQKLLQDPPAAKPAP